MENKIHFKTEKEVTQWLLGIVNTEEEYNLLLRDLARIEAEELIKGGKRK